MGLALYICSNSEWASIKGDNMKKTMQQLKDEYDVLQNRLDTAWWERPRWAVEKAEREIAAWEALNGTSYRRDTDEKDRITEGGN